MSVNLSTAIPCLSCLGIGAILCYGAYTDHKTRTIPNIIPGAILLFGLGTATPLWYKLVCFGIMVASLVLAAAITKQASGGGDLKLYCALSFALGILPVGVVLFLTLVLLGAHNIIKGKKRVKGERFPLCTYLAPAYFLYLCLDLLLMSTVNM